MFYVKQACKCLVVALLLLESTSPNARESDASVLVSPVLSERFQQELLEEFAKADLYDIGKKSSYLILIEADEQRSFGVFGQSTEATVKLTLIDWRGKRVASAEGKAGEAGDDTVLSAYERLLKVITSELASAGSAREVDWLTVYDRIHVSKAINDIALCAKADPFAYAYASTSGHFKGCGYSTIGQTRTDAANYQDLIHHYISVRDVRALNAMLPLVGFYGGDIPIISNFEYYRDNEIFGASAGNLFLHTAAFVGDKEVFDLLYQVSPNLGAENRDGLAPMEIAAAALNFDLFLHMAELDPEEGRRNADVALTWLLLFATGLDRQLDSWPDRRYLKADIDKSPETIGRLVGELKELGASVNQVWVNGYTPLHAAVVAGDADLARLLLENGADANLSGNGIEKSPLRAAILAGDGEAASLLLEYGAEVREDSAAPLTLLVAAIRQGLPEVVAYLVNEGAPVSVGANKGLSPLIEALAMGDQETVQLLLSSSADPDDKDIAGRSPLLVAMQLGHEDIALELVEHGAAVDIPNDEGQQPIHVAASLRQVKIIQALVEKGSDVNATDGQGRTPLHYAYPGGDRELDEDDHRMIGVLVDLGGDRRIESYDGFTAAGYYREQRRQFTLEQERIERERARAEQLAREARERERREQLARQRREEQERQRRMAQREAERQQNGFQWGKALAMGAGFLAGGGAELDAETQAETLLGIAMDSRGGQAGMSSTMSALDSASQRYQKQGSAAAPASPPAYQAAASTSSTRNRVLKPNVLASADDMCEQNVQVSTMCQTANLYYERYVALANAGNVDPSEMYEVHKAAANEAIRFMQSSRADVVIDAAPANTASPAPTSARDATESSSSSSGPQLDCWGRTPEEAAAAEAASDGEGSSVCPN